MAIYNDIFSVIIHLMVDQPKIKLYLLWVICAALGLFMARAGFDYLSETQNKSLPEVKPQPVAVVVPSVPSPVVIPPVPSPTLKKAPRPALVLNGIVISPGASYALINNKIVKENDSIEGIKVVRITKDSVELQDGDTSFKLSLNLRSF